MSAPEQPYDVVIVGGGPAGLSAALAFGRARKRVLVCDAGPRRNAAAVHVHNFVTRDGVTPTEFRLAAHEQLRAYPGVATCEMAVESITGSCGAFSVTLASDGETTRVEARRVLLACGMIDELPSLPGFADAWGASVFQCPYCHGWEVQGQRWGYLPAVRDASMFVHFALLLRGWTDDLVVFTNAAFEVPHESQESLSRAGIQLETRPIRSLRVGDGQLRAVALDDEREVPRDVLFAHPPQRHVEVVRTLDVALDEHGYVVVDAMRRETSVRGVYAAGDLTTRQQGAIIAAAAGMHAATVMNAELNVESALGATAGD